MLRVSDALGPVVAEWLSAAKVIRCEMNPVPCEWGLVLGAHEDFS